MDDMDDEVGPSSRLEADIQLAQCSLPQIASRKASTVTTSTAVPVVADRSTAVRAALELRLPRILASPSIVALAEQVADLPSSDTTSTTATTAGDHRTPIWVDPRGGEFEKITLGELDRKGVYPLSLRGSFPKHGDYTRSFVRSREKESVLYSRAMAVQQKGEAATSRQPRQENTTAKYPGFNEYAVHYDADYIQKSRIPKPRPVLDDDDDQELSERDALRDTLNASAVGLKTPHPTLDNLWIPVGSSEENVTTASIISAEPSSDPAQLLPNQLLNQKKPLTNTVATSEKSPSPANQLQEEAIRAPKQHVKWESIRTRMWAALAKDVQESLSEKALRELNGSLADKVEEYHNSILLAKAKARYVDPNETVIIRHVNWTELEPAVEETNKQAVEISFRNGSLVVTSLAFHTFKKQNQSRWGPIAVLLADTELVARRYNLTFLALDSNRVETVASRLYTSCPRLSSRELLEQLSAMPDATVIAAQSPGRKYKYEPTRRLNAAITIQAAYKAFKTRSSYQSVLDYVRAANVFLKYWRMSKRKAPLRAARQALDEFHAKRASSLNALLPKTWSPKASKVFVVVSSVPAPSDKKTENYLQFRHFTRTIFRTQPDARFIFVSREAVPQSGQDQILKSMLGLHPAMQKDFAARFQVVVPENANLFRPNATTTAILLGSPIALQSIKKQVANEEQVYLMTGSLTSMDYQLASHLELPMLAPKNLSVYRNLSSHAFTRNMARLVGISIPVGVENIRDKENLYFSLASLVRDHPQVQRWLFLLDQHVVAYLDISAALKRTISSMESAQELAAYFAQELEETLTILDVWTYSTWTKFVEAFLRWSGGVIVEAHYKVSTGGEALDATAMVHVFMDPKGNLEYRGSSELWFMEPEAPLLELLPQKRIDHPLLWGIVLQLGKSIYEMGGTGFYSMEFGVNPGAHVPNIHASDVLFLRLIPHYSPQASNCDSIATVGECHFDAKTGNLLYDMHSEVRRKIAFLQQARFLDMKKVVTESNVDIMSSHWEERCAVVCETMWHSNMEFIDRSVVHSLLSGMGFQFEMRDRLGTMFLPFALEKPSTMGFLALLRSREDLLDHTVTLLPLIQRILSSTEVPGKDNFTFMFQRLSEMSDRPLLGADIPTMANNFLKSAEFKTRLAQHLQKLEQLNAETEEEMAKVKEMVPDELEFVNPSKALWGNPFAKSMQGTNAKRRLMSTFIVEELMEGVILPQVLDAVGRVEVERIKRREALRKSRSRRHAPVEVSFETTISSTLEWRAPNAGEAVEDGKLSNGNPEGAHLQGDGLRDSPRDMKQEDMAGYDPDFEEDLPDVDDAQPGAAADGNAPEPQSTSVTAATPTAAAAPKGKKKLYDNTAIAALRKMFQKTQNAGALPLDNLELQEIDEEEDSDEVSVSDK